MRRPVQLTDTLRLSTLAVVLLAAGQASAADLRGTTGSTPLTSVQCALRASRAGERALDRAERLPELTEPYAVAPGARRSAAAPLDPYQSAAVARPSLRGPPSER